jgi:protocatechuate 3,4-dioxygenase beta subunit/peroxiredoxin
MRGASCLVLSLLLGLVLGNLASAGTGETVAVGEITGKVLMPDGSPAAGAHVRVIGFRVTEGFPLTYEQLWTLEAPVAEDGTFRFQPDPIAKDKVSAQIAVTVAILATHESAGATGTTVYRTAAEVGQALAAGSLKLNEPATLTGTVTDGAGRPVAQATVILMGWVKPGRASVQVLPEMSPLRAATQADGTFAFDRVPNGAQFMLLVQKEGHPDVYLMSAGVMPAGVSVSIVVPEAGSLTGRVVSAAGEPVAGCHVSFAAPPNQQPRQPGPWVMAKDVATGQDGRFTVPTLFPAAYDLRVEPPASAQDKWAPSIVTNQTVAASETKDVGDIVLTAGGTLSGKVTDSKTGKPLAGARVTVSAAGARSMVAGWYTKTDADGHYEFHLPAGTYQAYASVPGYGSPQDFLQRPALTVETGGRTESNFELQPVFTVKGRLLLPDGSPAANCSIGAPIPSNPYQSARSDGSGRFTLERVTPGEQVDLSASDPEHGARLATTFTVSEDKAEVTFTMEKAASCLLTGRVVDDEGKPVAGMQVMVVERAGNMSLAAGSGTTGADGRFTIKALQGGEGSILLGEGGGTITADLKLRLDSERIDKGDLVAPRLDQQVAGVVVDIDGEPVPGADVQGNGVTMRVYAQAQTGSDGRFRLTKLPKDTIQIEAFLVDPESRIVRSEVRQQVLAGATDLRLVMGIKQKADVRAAAKAGEQAPELVLERGAGAALAQFKGKPVVLVFVSIFSRPSVKVLDDLKALQEKQGADKLEVIAVHDRTASPQEIEQFRKDHSTPFPIVRVPDAPRDGWDSATFRAYGVTALPTVVLIDNGGKVASVGDSGKLSDRIAEASQE